MKDDDDARQRGQQGRCGLHPLCPPLHPRERPWSTPEFLGSNKVFLALIYLPQTPCFACQGTLIYSPPRIRPLIWQRAESGTIRTHGQLSLAPAPSLQTCLMH